MAWRVLDERAHGETEGKWRSVYGPAFSGRGRVRTGAKAEYAYQCEQTDHYLIVPFLSDVPGVPMHARGRRMSAHECWGQLLSLADFRDVELFVSPVDLGWTLVHTHEDYAWGGPYFIRADWLR